MSNSTTAAYLSLENIAVSAIIAVVGIFGLLSNAAAMISVRCNPVLRSSFGVLCFSHSVANFGVMLVFVFWVTPMTVIHSDISSELLGKIFGQINIMFWDIMNHQGSGSTVSLAAHKKRRQIETRFFMQTLYQNALFFYEISNFYYVTVLFTDPWAVFFTSTFAWEICHAFDGFVVVLFNFHLSFIGIHTTKTRSAMISEHKKTTSAWHIVTNG
ncbi:hypothetical protein NECAME_07847 [Necator americanus]|uniref:7TM GPCR serpentine receptor class x (Srx) domain-containing protein n=1 Tax=Necator americanus TaxID=51031 RepID=W2TLD1_NECAM|nr:hypothetical protein NECAME_07847 [Necator americanus]ETN82593.1 hypothetical protein NECAME_07847 [Necator americanus]